MPPHEDRRAQQRRKDIEEEKAIKSRAQGLAKIEPPSGIIEAVVQLSSRFFEGAPAPAPTKVNRLMEPKGSRPKQRIKAPEDERDSTPDIETAASQEEVILTPFEVLQRNAVRDFLEASARGDDEACRQMADAGAPIHLANEKGWTAIHVAARYGHVALVETLLDLQLDDEAKDLMGRTALHVAAEFGQLEVLELLIDIGTDVNIRAGSKLKRWSPLMFAAASNNVEIIGALLHTDGDLVDTEDADGNTALAIAMAHKCSDAAHALEAAAEARRVRTKKQEKKAAQQRRLSLDRASSKRLLRQNSSFSVANARSPSPEKRASASSRRFSSSFSTTTSESFRKLHNGFRRVSMAASVLARLSSQHGPRRQSFQRSHSDKQVLRSPL